MAPPYPRLRPDLIVQQLQQDGRDLVQLMTPDRKAGRRVSQRAYQAMQLLDGETSVDHWMASFAQSHPGVTTESMKRMLESLIRDGFCLLGPDAEVDADATGIRPDPMTFGHPSGRAPEPLFVTDPNLKIPSAAELQPERPPYQDEDLLREEDRPPASVTEEEQLDASTAPLGLDTDPPRTFDPRVITSTRSAPDARPLRRSDLVSSRPNAAGQVAVKNPSTGRSFPIEGYEFAALQLMDGERSAEQIIGELVDLGREIDAGEFARIVRQLNGYGFLERTGDAPSAPAQPQGEWTDEHRRLFEGGQVLLRQGQLEQAESYFAALLELAPDNPEARSMLERVRLERAQAAERAAAPAQPEAEEDPAEQDDEEFPDTPPPAPAADVWDQAKVEVRDAPDVVRRRWQMRLRRLGKLLLIPAAALLLSLVIWIPLTITYPCQVKPLQHATVRTPMDGVVADVLVDEGVRVKKGQLLGRMQSADLKTALAKSEAEHQRISAELDLLKKGSRQEEIDQVKARVAGLGREVGLASRRVKRLKRLLKQGVAPRAELESAQAQLAAVSGQLRQARAELKLTQAGAREDDLKQKEAELRGVEAQRELNEKLLAASEIKAPMDGIVTSPKPKDMINTRVTQGTTLFEVALMEHMRVEILVSERDFDVLEIGQEMSTRVASFPTREFGGKVTRIPQRVELVDGQTVIRVESEIANTENLLRPNMTGYAKISGEKMPLLGIVFRRLVRWVRVRFLI